ncbi:MAG: class I SAM-dependent methyltransferase [Candidatus Burarchaeum sp.]|nr:class I SAM-dependent methyltransferase [Candidatus Burarchaeum sp.]MDO8339894.1 class I SAM-dependent methyltransferase [Candidatus Burarchaeum sp.]
MDAMNKDNFRQNAIGNPISAYALENRLSEAIGRLPEKIGELLDIGCGEGWFLKKISVLEPKAKLFGVDICEVDLDYAERLVPTASFSVYGAYKLPFKAGKFDCVTMLEVLDHLDEPDRALKEANRVLKKDGTLFVSVPDESLLRWRFVWKIWTNTLGRKWNHKHLQKFNVQSFNLILDKNGFEVVDEKRALFGCIMIAKTRKIR